MRPGGRRGANNKQQQQQQQQEQCECFDECWEEDERVAGNHDLDCFCHTSPPHTALIADSGICWSPCRLCDQTIELNLQLPVWPRLAKLIIICISFAKFIMMFATLRRGKLLIRQSFCRETNYSSSAAAAPRCSTAVLHPAQLQPPPRPGWTQSAVKWGSSSKIKLDIRSAI